jgi:SRR1.
MPHTSRKKRANVQKRLEIADEGGWTHVTRGGNVPRRAVKTTEGELLPADPPSKLTIGELEKQYETHRERWNESSTSEILTHALRERLARSMKDIDNIVCIGLGSPSGFLRGGWVDRRSVSLYQLAALASIAEFFSKSYPVSLKLSRNTNNSISQKKSDTDSRTVKVFAQDPVFNDFDKELLQSLGITMVEDPKAFELVNEHTFLYCPGAERAHLDRILASNPAILFGGPLDNISPEQEVLASYVQERSSLQLPTFEPHEHAFWNMRIYWKYGDN